MYCGGAEYCGGGAGGGWKVGDGGCCGCPGCSRGESPRMENKDVSLLISILCRIFPIGMWYFHALVSRIFILNRGSREIERFLPRTTRFKAPAATRLIHSG